MKSRFLPSLAPLAGLATLLMASSASAALVSHYALEEGTGTSTAQLVADGAPDGSLVGENTIWVPGIAPGSSTGLSFEAGSRVEIAGNDLWHGLNGFSVSAWIQPSSHAGEAGLARPIFWLGTAAGSARFTFQLNDYGDLRAGGRRAGNESFSVVGTNTGLTNGSGDDPIQIGQTYHVAATADYSTGLVSIYVNGALVVSDTIAAWGTGPTASDQNYVMRIGSNHNGGEQFLGIIDDVRLYDSVLSASDVAALAVPEPSVALLGLFGAAGLLRRRHRAG